MYKNLFKTQPIRFLLYFFQLVLRDAFIEIGDQVVSI